MLSDEEKLAGAALDLKHVGDTSVPVILNIIGNDLLTLLHTKLFSHTHSYSTQSILLKRNVICSPFLVWKFIC